MTERKKKELAAKLYLLRMQEDYAERHFRTAEQYLKQGNIASHVMYLGFAATGYRLVARSQIEIAELKAEIMELCHD